MQCLRALSLIKSNIKLIRHSRRISCIRKYGVNKLLMPHPMATVVFDQSFTIQSFNYSTAPEDLIDSITFDKVSEETLQSLTEYFEEIAEENLQLKDADISYSSGVLTIALGKPFGTYVINKQTPNRQIWLSSPTSGPKRYDFVPEGEYWVYKHSGETLHQLLQNEIPKIVKSKVDFTHCAHCRL